MQNLIEKSGFIETAQLLKNHLLGGAGTDVTEKRGDGRKNEHQAGKFNKSSITEDCLSEITVYQNAIQPAQINMNRESTSSGEDDAVDISDESGQGSNDLRGENIDKGDTRRSGQHNIQLLISEVRNNLRGREETVRSRTPDPDQPLGR